MPPFKRIFRDHFDGATSGRKDSLGNGSIVQAGTALTISGLAGSNCDWWTYWNRAPIARHSVRNELGPRGEDAFGGIRRGGFFYTESRVTAFTYSATTCFLGGLALTFDLDNALWVGWYPADSKIYVQRIQGDIGYTDYTSGSTYTGPSTAAHRYRIYWNVDRGSRSVLIPADNRVLSYWTYAVYVSVNDGSAWTFHYAAALPFYFQDAGVFVRNWSAWPSFSATFDYLDIWEDPSVRESPTYTSGVADAVKFPMGGERSPYLAGGGDPYSGSGGRGWYLPDRSPTAPAGWGDSGHTSMNVSRLHPQQSLSPRPYHPLWLDGTPVVDPAAGGTLNPSLDEALGPTVNQLGGVVDHLVIGGPNRAHFPFQIYSGRPFQWNTWLDGDCIVDPAAGGTLYVAGNPHSVAGHLDLVTPQLDPSSTYQQEKTDADGRPYFGGYEVSALFLYQADQDPWHAHAAGHYGAGRNGKYYWNGEECGTPAGTTGSLGDPTNGLNRRAFGTFNEKLPSCWPTAGCTIDFPSTNQLRFNIAATAGPTANIVMSNHRWFLDGDFTLDVDFLNVSINSIAADGGFFMEALVDNENYFYVRRRVRGANSIDKNVRNVGTWSSWTEVAYAGTSGKMRLKRVGAVVSSWYWNGSAWVQIGASYTMTHGTKRMQVRLGHYFDNDVVSGSCTFTNFTLTEGSYSNRPAWAVEPAGTYRGSRTDFPETALIACTKSSVDIIDVLANKLWMSFRVGASSALPTSCQPRAAYMKDGVLIISAATDPVQSEEGASVVVDFTLDWTQIHRAAASSITGAYQRPDTGCDEGWPRDWARGNIIFRNGGGSYLNDDDHWQQPVYRAYGSVILFDGDEQFWALATYAGVSAYQWRRWWVESADVGKHKNMPKRGVSTETAIFKWISIDPATKDLLYSTGLKLYVAHEATWKTGVTVGGGSWTADHNWTLPDAPMTESQQPFARLSSGLYLFARGDSVYTINPATGAVVKRYGPVGSGATWEVLPYDSVGVLAVGTGIDGVTTVDVLAVQMRNSGQVLLIDNTVGTIYGRAPLKFGTEAMAMVL